MGGVFYLFGGSLSLGGRDDGGRYGLFFCLFFCFFGGWDKYGELRELEGFFFPQRQGWECSSHVLTLWVEA